MMSISVEGRLFHLRTKGTSYILGYNTANRMRGYYYGSRIDGALGVMPEVAENITEAGFFCLKDGDEAKQCAMSMPLEYSGCNTGDFRYTALGVTRLSNGARWSDLRYKSHRVSATKRELVSGLPQSFGKENMEQLVVTLEDTYTGIEVDLLYTVFEECDVIVRSSIIRNVSQEAIRLDRALSLQLDLVGRDGYDMVDWYGHWNTERMPERVPLRHGMQVNSSCFGTTSHVSTPAIVLSSPGATETAGEALAAVLVYSGNHFESAEVNAATGAMVRVLVGINPEGFSWDLASGESFETPEVILTRSGEGYGKMSRNLHDFIREHIMTSVWTKKLRPILLNSWEGVFFNFDKQKVLDMARASAKQGIEMFVLDDGWFGHRDDDTTSLGDWFEYESKVGKMPDLVADIHAMGLKFGLWFEPEMVSEDSDLYRAHPDWAIRVPEYSFCRGRQQMILDFGRDEVVDCVYGMMSKLIREAKIDYIKWDMNRYMTDTYSRALPPERQGEAAHRFTLGMYRLHRMLIKEFPELLIEGCSGGGGRFDAGMLQYVPQIWCSDNSNAIDRLSIQAGTSLLYPVCAMGAHVNKQHTVWRDISYATRGNVAMAGTFGYELDMTLISEEDAAMTRKLNEEYHRYHDIYANGDYYRLTDLFKMNAVEAWAAATKAGDRALLTVVIRQTVGCLKDVSMRYQVPGLRDDARYAVYANGEKLAEEYTGSFLKNFGIAPVALDWREGGSAVYYFERV